MENVFFVIMAYLMFALIRCLFAGHANRYMGDCALREIKKTHKRPGWYIDCFNVAEFIFSPTMWHVWTGDQACRFYKNRERELNNMET